MTYEMWTAVATGFAIGVLLVAFMFMRVFGNRGDLMFKVVVLLLVVGLVVLFARAVRLEFASDDEQLRQHLNRLEQHQPGALDRIREIADEQRH